MSLMEQGQWAGICYLLAALLLSAWWKLKVQAELDERNQDDEEE